MAVPPIDFSALPPEGSSRPGGPGLEAAANRYIERMRREAKEKGQAPQEGNGDKMQLLWQRRRRKGLKQIQSLQRAVKNHWYHHQAKAMKGGDHFGIREGRMGSLSSCRPVNFLSFLSFHLDN
jgi:hypothetical protein